MAVATKGALAIICLASLLSVIDGQCTLQAAKPRFRRAIFDFSSNLIKRVAYEEQYHFVVSPLSIWTVLSVAAEGAGGKTYEELRRVLRLNKLPCFKNKYYKFVRDLSVQNAEVTFERSGLIVANQILRVKKRFQKMVKNKLEVAEVMDLDFYNTDESARAINQYVSEQTHGKIQEVIYPKDFSDAVMFLIDTVYFKGQWRVQFDPRDTIQSAFYNEQGLEAGQVNLMVTREGLFNVTNIEMLDSRVLELPYGSDDRISMLVFLPNDNVQLSNVINNLDKISLMAIFKKFSFEGPINVEIQLPRFTVTSEMDSLKDLMLDMGVKLLFNELQADLSGIADDPLYVSRLIQKANIEVTEEGTVASAVSTGFVSARSQPDMFKADKPFLYLIVERNTQSIIFAGAYSTPSLY